MTSYNQHYKAELTGATQGDGAKTIDVSGATKSDFLIFVTTSGAVTAGTLAVGVLPKEAPSTASHQALATTIDLTSPKPYKISGIALRSIEVTPSSFDGDSYNVYVTGI